MKDRIQSFHRDDVTYLPASTGSPSVRHGCKFDHDAFRLTPILLDGSDGPVVELREMYDRSLMDRERKGG